MSIDAVRAETVRMRGFLRAAETQATKVIGLVDRMLRPTGLWISREELRLLPMSGPAWDAMVAVAAGPYVSPDLADGNSHANTDALARALVYARTGDEGMRSLVVDALYEIAAGGPYVGNALSLGRELCAYVIAADLVALPAHEPVLDAAFRAKLLELLETPTTGAAASLIDSHERRPNNWGAMAGASRIAIALYLDDRVDLERAATVFRGYLGERSAYDGFTFRIFAGDWQPDHSAPVAILPVGAEIDGHSLDGAQPEELRRWRGGTNWEGEFTWPPPKVNYSWEALQGSAVQATLLHRAGYPAWSWGDQALLRALRWLHDVVDFPAVGDDTGVPWLANYHLGTAFPAPSPTRPGKVMGFTDWTHARST